MIKPIKIGSTTLRKASKTTQGVFNVIPKEFRISLAIIGGGLLAYKLYKKFNPSEEEVQKEELEKEAIVVKDPDTGKTQTCAEKLSYSKSQYKAWADNMYSYFINSLGTDEAGVYDVINKMKNECDLRQLIADFGLRRQEWSFSEYSLPWFMRDELSKNELGEVNRILRTKRINYQF